MTELKFVSTKGWVASETGWYAVSLDGQTVRETLLWLSKGEKVGSQYAPFIAGPITILPPEPELELPEGWVVENDKVGVGGNYYVISVIKDTHAKSSNCLTVTRPTRAECVTVINRMVKAAEGK